MLTPRILVTRPLPQGERTAAKLHEMGYEPILAPMLRINPITPADLPDFNALQAILVTSANGIERLAALTPLRDTPLLTVGDRTAKTAETLGFRTIKSASGNGNALLTLAHNTLNPLAGPLLHIRGQDAAITFTALAESGFNVTEAITYEAIQLDALPPGATNPPPAAALVYSARTAQALAGALSHSTLDPTQLTIIGISPASVDPLISSNTRCITANTPTEDALLTALSEAIPLPKKN